MGLGTRYIALEEATYMCCDFTWSNESIFSKIDKILI